MYLFLFILLLLPLALASAGSLLDHVLSEGAKSIPAIRDSQDILLKISTSSPRDGSMVSENIVLRPIRCGALRR